MRRFHDLGGLNAGPVDINERNYLPWEKHVDAIVRILSSKNHQILRVDELRRGIEDLSSSTYERFSYYERWISSIAYILIEKDIININELYERIKFIKSKEDFLS
jgi:hypothetical protein